MSWRVTNLCSEHRFGSPVRKQIIMYMADKASDDGSGIWCSKGTIARHCELGGTTVKRTISEFLAEGILVETGRRPCTNGFTAIYQIVLHVVQSLDALSDPDPDQGTRSAADGVPSGPGRGSRAAGVPGPQRTPNHPQTIRKPPPPREIALEVKEVAEDFEQVWKAYPPDRLRDRTTSLRRMKEALTEVTADELLAAVRAYAAESEGFTRSKVSFLDNWLREGKWRRHVDEHRRRKADAESAAAKQFVQIAGWVKARHGMCKHVSEGQVRAAMQLGAITLDEAQAAGFLR
jgi:hypothetical protein